MTHYSPKQSKFGPYCQCEVAVRGLRGSQEFWKFSYSVVKRESFFVQKQPK